MNILEYEKDEIASKFFFENGEDEIVDLNRRINRLKTKEKNMEREMKNLKEKMNKSQKRKKK